MGYRTYIGSMPKKEYNKIKSLTFDEIKAYYPSEDEDWYKGVYDYGKELYEFGSYTDFQPPKKSIKKFFKNKDLMAHYDEYDFYVVTKEFLAYVISSYQEYIKKYYTDMIFGFDLEEKSEFMKSIKNQYDINLNKEYTFDCSKISINEQTAIVKMIYHIRSMSIEWNVLTPFNLETGDQITTSWKYEYGIFELIKIYKTFDWKKNIMIYYGY